MTFLDYIFGKNEEEVIEAALAEDAIANQKKDMRGTSTEPRPVITEEERVEESAETETPTPSVATAPSSTSTPTPLETLVTDTTEATPTTPTEAPVRAATPTISTTSNPNERYKQLLKDTTPESDEKITKFTKDLIKKIGPGLKPITIDGEEHNGYTLIASDLATAVKLRNEDLADYVVRHYLKEVVDLPEDKKTALDTFIASTKKQIIIGKGDDEITQYKERNSPDLSARDQAALEVLLGRAFKFYDRAEAVITKADELIGSKELSLAQALLNQYDKATGTKRKDIFDKQTEIIEIAEENYDTATEGKLDNRGNVEVMKKALKSLNELLHLETPYQGGKPTEDSKDLVGKYEALSKKARQDTLRVDVQEYVNLSLAGEEDTDSQKLGAIFETVNQSRPEGISSEGLMTEYKRLKQEADSETNQNIKIKKLQTAFNLTPLIVDNQGKSVCHTDHSKEHFWNAAKYGKDLEEALIKAGNYEKALNPINFSLTVARGLTAQGNKEIGERKGLISNLTFDGYTAASNLAEQAEAQSQYEAANALYEQALNMLGEHASQKNEKKQKTLKRQVDELRNKYLNNGEAWAIATANKPASEITKSEIKNAFDYFLATSKDEQGNPHIEAIPRNIRERESLKVLDSIRYEFGRMNEVLEQQKYAQILDPSNKVIERMIKNKNRA